MVRNLGDIAFTPRVKAVQEALGPRKTYARLEQIERRTRLAGMKSGKSKLKSRRDKRNFALVSDG